MTERDGFSRAAAELLPEGSPDECRRRAAAVDPEQLLADPSAGGALRHAVDDRRQRAGPRRERMNVRHRAGGQRRAVAAPVVGKKLALEARDVDADRALRLARAAFEAQIEHVV